MGVPKFYRWLSERYPKINQTLNDDSVIPGVDHFYLDMNGIIHGASHPDDEIIETLSNEDILQAIDLYLDTCIDEIIKPQQSIFLAIDGVAPRAKLNQQRSRRFRAGKER